MKVPKRHRLEQADLAAIESLDQDDPVRPLIAEILSIVRVSYWSFARFKNSGSIDQLLSPESANTTTSRREEFEHLRKELQLQRKRTPKGPKLAASLNVFPEPYVSGITLVFADMRREFGVLNLLRTEDLGAFRSAEMQALALALDSSADRLSGFTIAQASPEAPPADATDQAMYVLDRDLRVILTFDAKEGRSAAITPVQARLAERLPPIIEDAVRKIVQTWTSDPATQKTGMVQPVPFLTVRAQPLRGPTGVFVGILLQRPQGGGQVFNKAAKAFNLSPREIETLAMLMQGAMLNDVAQTMHITTSTVQDHIRSMLEKTGTRNRSELIAKLLRPGLVKQLRQAAPRRPKYDTSGAANSRDVKSVRDR